MIPRRERELQRGRRARADAGEPAHDDRARGRARRARLAPSGPSAQETRIFSPGRERERVDVGVERRRSSTVVSNFAAIDSSVSPLLTGRCAFSSASGAWWPRSVVGGRRPWRAVVVVAVEPPFEPGLDEDDRGASRRRRKASGATSRAAQTRGRVVVYHPETDQTSPRSRAASAAAALRQSAPSTRKA